MAIIAKIFSSIFFLFVCLVALIPAQYAAGWLYVHGHSPVVYYLGGFLAWFLTVSFVSWLFGME